MGYEWGYVCIPIYFCLNRQDFLLVYTKISLRLENLILLCNHLGFLSVCGNVCIPFHGRLYTSRGVGAKVPTSILVVSSFGASLF